MTGNTAVRFADTTLLNRAIDSQACALTFGYALLTGEALTVSVLRVLFPRPRREISGPQGVQMTFAQQTAQQTNGNPMVTVTIANGIGDD